MSTEHLTSNDGSKIQVSKLDESHHNDPEQNNTKTIYYISNVDGKRVYRTIVSEEQYKKHRGPKGSFRQNYQESKSTPKNEHDFKLFEDDEGIDFGDKSSRIVRPLGDDFTSDYEDFEAAPQNETGTFFEVRTCTASYFF